ncbi:MAG TPA: hypothetical protein VGM80_00150 [Gaiellaceae bacterium]|jgi:hypothetical protein
MRFLAAGLAAGLLAAALVGGTAAGSTRASVPAGQYYFSHSAGANEFTGALKLHGSSVSDIGITTNLIACTRPPSKKVQFPGPPDNWQPQKTIPVKHRGANLTFSYSGTFADRISGYPEEMSISGTITPAGTITGRASMKLQDTTASTGEILCHTRGFVSFTGKRSS